MRRELEERFVLAHFLRSNTEACAKAEYHGGEGAVEQRHDPRRPGSTETEKDLDYMVPGTH